MPKITMSNKVAARPETIWQAIGSFGAIANWHPMIERAETAGAGSGSTRTLHLVGGAKLIERLEQENPGERRYSYSLVDGPLPIRDYKSEIKVSDNGDGTSTIEWSSSFEPTTGDANASVKTIEDLYRAGLDNIQKLYGMGR